jgi:RND family efflux transporter MFP subunit
VISRLSCAAALVTLASCSRPEASSVAAKSPDVATVRVAKAGVENLAHDIVLTAEFRPYQEVDVMAKVAGYIREIKVDAGDRVREGQLLATLEIPEMADDQRRAQAAIDRSQAEVARAQDELKRVQETQNIAHVTSERLIGVSKQRPGLIAQQELDDAKSRDLSAQAQVAAARSSLIAAEQQVRVNSSDLERVKTMFEYTRVTAPFAGVITKRYADKGSMIQAGTASNTQASPVVRLSENSLLRLILPVPESAVSTVHIGQRVEVAVPTMKRTFPGKVARFSDKLAAATRTMDTEVDVQNSDLLLIPGMYAEVHLTMEHRENVVAIPVTAVDIGVVGGGESAARRVFVITPENRVEIRTIEAGIETADKVEVKSGVHEGEMVVTGSRAGLTAGQEVRPKLQ